MLRVETSNLNSPRLRPRRLHASPAPASVTPATSRQEIPPPPNVDLDALPERHARDSFHSPAEDRWSVRLQLKDSEIAKLYAQGMTRGAEVWREGDPEWRPLLITPELSGLLRAARVIPTPPPLSIPDAITLPRAAPVPRELAPSFEPAADLPDVSTWAPTALDVKRASPARRGGELFAVAALAFAVAWFARGAAETPPGTASAATTGLEPAEHHPRAVLPPPAQSSTSGEHIPRLAVSQLPLLEAANEPTSRASFGRRGSRRGASTAAGGPGRAALTSALSRVAQASASCGERGGPVRVVVTFANSGVARGIQVSGKALPSTTRSCIIGAASRARVPAFDGAPVSVSKTL